MNENMAVVDASAAVCALRFDGEARAVLSTRSLFAPHLVDLEVAQTLRRQALAGRMESEDGALLLRGFQALGLTRYPVYGLTERIWELRDNLTAYDASYVAVAEALGCPLVTADSRLARAPGIRCLIELVPN